MRTWVVIPTYQESANVVAMIDALLAISPHICVCVVDDSSPDGTSDLVAAGIAGEITWGGRVELIVREGKGGRGGAVRAGLGRGLDIDPGFEAFVEMDCDFSHDPSAVERGSTLVAGGWDVVIGARYPDGEIVGWPLQRRIFSKMANVFARALISWSVPDYTNGFRFYSPTAVEAIISEPQRHTGYIYLSETLAVCLARDLSVTSFPITFRNRERGTSNTDLKEIGAAAKGIIDVARWYRRARAGK